MYSMGQAEGCGKLIKQWCIVVHSHFMQYHCRVNMEQNSFMVVFTSDTSKDIHPENSPSHFLFNLPRPLDFSDRNWEVRLVNITLPKILQTYRWFSICLRGVGESIMGKQYSSLLSTVHCPKRNTGCQSFQSDIYCSVRLNTAMFLEVYIIDENQQYVSFATNPVTVTLHFKNTATP